MDKSKPDTEYTGCSLVTPAPTGHLCFVRFAPRRRGVQIKGVVEQQEINSAMKHAKEGVLEVLVR